MRNWSFRTVMSLAAFAMLTVFSVSSVMAQATTGSIRGVVADTNGAVVAGATVMLKNEGTGVESTTTTNGEGIYSFGSLAPGKYTVTVQQPNFKKYVQTGVAVNIGVVSGVDVPLEAGNVSEIVTVTSNSEEVLQTEQSQISGSIDSRRVEELPSNGAGNGLDTLALLIPGVVANRVGGTNTNGTGLSVNGNRGRSNNFQIDGADNNDLSVGGPALFIGFADAVQEFQVITNNFDASYGRNQGAIINYVTKGGTNDFHGSAFWHHQNATALDSLDNISKRSGVTENDFDLWNVFGGTLGGPIMFPAFGEGGPRIWNGRDKAFFFVGYQGTRNPAQFTSRSTSLAILDTEFGRLQSTFPGNNVINTIVQASPFAIGSSPFFGDIRLNATSVGTPVPSQFNLSAPVGCPRGIAVTATPPPGCGTYTTFINPSTGQPFLTGGPYDTLNLGTALAPALFQAAQYERTGSVGYTEDNYVFRIDVVPTSKDNVTFRFYDQEGVSDNAVGSIASGMTGNLPAGSRNFGGSWAHTFSNSLLNDFRASYQKIIVDFGGGCDIDFVGCIPGSADLGLAFANISFPVALGLTKTNAMPTIGPATNIPQGRTGKVYQVADFLNLVRGKHSIRFGAEFKSLPTLVPFLPNFNGTYGFNTAERIRNNAPNSLSVALGEPLLEFGEKDQYYFFQDDFKPMPNLTLNLGVRYEYTGQPINQLHELTLARESNPATAFFKPSIPIEQRIVPKVAPDKNNFAPRLGFAWSPNPEGGFLKTLFGENATVIRGGYSWAYEPAFYNILVNIMSNTPVALATTVPTASLPATGSSAALPANPRGINVRPAIQAANILVIGVQDPKFLNWVDVSPDFHSPYSRQWSFGVQRQMGRNHIFEARYVGNKGVDLFQNINGNFFIGPLVNGFALNRNPATGARTRVASCASIGNPATCVDFPSFSSQLPSGTVSQVCTNDPTTPFDNEAACNERQFRRGGLTTRSNDGFSSYHGLQTRYNGRLLNDSLRLGAAYTFSKTIDNASEIFSFGDISSPNAQNPFCIKDCEKSLSNLNRPHAFSANFLFDVPFFKEQSGVLGRILGGWQINGTYVLTSGAAYTPSNNLAGTYGLGNTYLTAGDRSFIGNTSVDNRLVAISQIDAFMIFGAPLANPNGFYSMNTFNQNGSWVATTPNDVYYIINGPGAAKVFGTPFGTATRNTETGPIFNQFNLSLFKNIKVFERLRLQFRAEAFNAFNHPNPGYGVASGGSFGTIALTQAGALGNEFANDTDITLANRVIQLGFKIIF